MTESDSGHFEVLDEVECLGLLREATIGRVAFEGPSGLTVLPLAHRMDGRRVVLRTAEGTELARVADGTGVAFEVDEFDAEVANGWSVLVRGTLRRLSSDEVSREAFPEPFVPGDRRLLLGIEGASLSGRAVSAD